MKDWQNPDAKSWVDVLDYRVTNDPEGIAIRFLADGENEAEVLTYSEFKQRCILFAQSVQPLAERGSRAVILLPNDVSFITSFFGCIYAGLVPVPGYPPKANRNQDRIIKVLRQSEARLIIGDGSLDRNEIMTDVANRGLRGVRIIDVNSLKPQANAKWVDPDLKSDDIAFLQYTSGSTSDPKGVCLTHHNLLANLEMLRIGFNIHPRSIMISWLPLYHDMGLIGQMLLSFYVGVPFIFMPPAAFVRRPLVYLRTLSKYCATVGGGPNFAYDLLVSRFNKEELEGVNLSSLELLFNGAEPIRSGTFERFLKTYSAYGVSPSLFFPCYGLAEASLYVAGGPINSGYRHLKVSKAKLQNHEISVDGEDLITLVSSGRIAPGVSVKIADPTTLALKAEMEVGEILVCAPSVSGGYWKLEDANRETFGLQLPDMQLQASGYLKTGDLGFLHENDLYVTGRIKDVIIVAGQNHYPQDIELTAQLRSRITSITAAFTLDDSERIGLLVEIGRTGSGADLQKEAVQIAEAIGKEHELSIARIAFVGPGELPRTSSGKVQRQLSRKRLLEGSFNLVGEWLPQQSSISAQVAAQNSPEFMKVQEIKEWIRKYCARRLNIELAHSRKTFPPNLVLELGNKGLMGMLISKADGGLGFNFREITEVIEQLAAIDISLALFVGINNLLGIQPLLNHGSPELKKKVLRDLAAGRALAGLAITEADAGSNPKAIKTLARPVDEGIEISGEKIWIGLAGWSSYLCVFAKEINAEGSPIGMSAFVVETDADGVTLGPEAMTMGVQPVIQNSLKFDRVKISGRQRLGEPGKGLAVAFESMNQARFGLICVVLGTLKRCYQTLASYSATRPINTGLMIENGMVIHRLREMGDAIDALEALHEFMVSRIDAGKATAEEYFMVCKALAPTLLWENVDSTLQFLGGRGYSEPNDLPRLMRDARLLRIFEGPTEAITYHLGASLLKDGVATLESENDGLNPTALSELQQDVNIFRDKIGVLGAPERAHLVACGLGEMASYKVLESIKGDAPWLRNRYDQARTRLLNDLALTHAGGGILQRTRRYGDQVGLVVPDVAGEDWERSVLKNGARNRVKAELATQTGNLQKSEAAPVASPSESIESPAPQASSTKSTDSLIISSDGMSSIVEFVQAQLATIKPALKGRVSEEARFAALGIDSIAAVELSMAIQEKIGVSVPDTLIWDHPTIGEACRYLHEISLKKS